MMITIFADEKPKQIRIGRFDAECENGTKQIYAGYLKLHRGRHTRANTQKYNELRRLEKSLHNSKKQPLKTNSLRNLKSIGQEKLLTRALKKKKPIAL